MTFLFFQPFAKEVLVTNTPPTHIHTTREQITRSLAAESAPRNITVDINTHTRAHLRMHPSYAHKMIDKCLPFM